jgi:nucleotide-binding universal stress UspA family protein
MAQLFRRILVPHDFSEHATAALGVAATLAAERGGSLLVVHAVPSFVLGDGLVPGEAWIPPEELVADALRRLEAIVKIVVGRRRIGCECRVLTGDPYQQILASAPGMDLIVMATAGRTGLSHLVIGSVAEKVVRHSPVPVLTVRPAARAAVRRSKKSK